MTPHDPDTPRHTPAFQAFTLAERVQELREALDHACHLHSQYPVMPDQRELLKQQIISLFREADAGLQQAQALKDAVKGLADQWKHLDGRGVAATISRPTPVVSTTVSSVTSRVDHLGASTYIEKGWSKLALMDAPGAEAAFRRALELAPVSLEALALLSWAQMEQQHYDAALETIQGVLQRDPQHALAHANLGYICLRRQAYGDAIEHLSTVIRADADRRAVLYAHLYLGMVYREREMYEDAEAFFGRALELGPNLLQGWYELGRTRWFAGRPREAKQAWKTGAEANKFSPWGKRCAEILTVVEQGGAPSRDG
jgi:tetratricopeptide (TPR) repeat protein